jgi:hypothetical protein
MSTKVITVVFILLVITLGLFLFGGDVSAPATTEMPIGDHTMSNGTMMQGADTMIPVDTGASAPHTMPDGSVMGGTGAHVMPDGTMMAQ